MSLLTTLLLIVPIATTSSPSSMRHAVAPEQAICDVSVHFRGTRTSISSHDSDDRNSVIDFLKVKDDRCTSATVVGRLTYSPAEDDIVAVPFGGHAVFRERSPARDRALTFTRGADGQVVRSFQVDGRNAGYDADAQRWFADFLPRILAEAGTNVEPRIARWRSQGDVENVLSRIAEIGSSGSRRTHYVALLDGGRLSNDEHERVIRGVSMNLRESSGDLRAVLTRAAPGFRVSRASIAALEDALANMPSSGDKRAVAQLYGETGNRDMLLAMMRVAQTIPSSGDNARLLQALAPRYLSDKDRRLQNAFFGVARTIPSSGDARRVLQTAVSYAPASPDVAMAIIEASRSIPSSGDRSALLISLVRSGGVQGKELRDAFFAAAAEIPSDGDRSRVLLAATR